MAVPRSVASMKGGFPLPTFQLRLRSLQSVIFIASAKKRRDYMSGYFYIGLHVKPDSEAFLVSPKFKWSTEREETRFVWNDVDISTVNVHPALKSVVVTIYFQPEDFGASPFVDTRWGIYFSGLLSLGNHPPPHGRLPTDAIVLCLSDNYFSSAAHLKDNAANTCNPRYLHIGKAEECQAVGSYDTQLLSRLQYVQRVLKKQEEVNHHHKKHLMLRGIVDVSESKNLPQAKKEGRPKNANMFSMQAKSAPTRLRESELQAQIERARVRVELLAFEKLRLQKEIEEINAKRKSIAAKIEEKNTTLMRDLHQLAREKSNFNDWYENFQENLQAHAVWTKALRRQQLSLIYSMSFIYPVGDLDSAHPTLRWISFPLVPEEREQSKNDISVVFGWLAELLTVISRILDAPLRYPISLQASTSTITDHFKTTTSLTDQDSREYPLFMGKGNSDWNLFAYGTFLLNKNLAQIRWQCGLETHDIRTTLKNMADLFLRGKDIQYHFGSEPKILPVFKELKSPHKAGDHQIILISGRAQIQGAIRGSSPTKSFQASINSSSSDALPMETSVDDQEIDRDELTDSSSSESESAVSNEVVSQQSSVPESPPGFISKTTLDDNPLSPNGSANGDLAGKEQFNVNQFWGDVATRTQALSNPSSFQRPRPQNQ